MGTVYTSDGKPLYEIVSAERCPECHHTTHRCRGLLGHGGWHWYYTDSGWLVRWGGGIPGSEHTPPGHQRYISPTEMVAKDVMAFTKHIPLSGDQAS